MGLEVTTTIAGLVATNPIASDAVGQADDHLRLIKNVLKTIFPGSGGSGFSTPLTATEAELNYVHGVTSAIQTQLNTISAAAATANGKAVTADGKAVAAQGDATTALANAATADGKATTALANAATADGKAVTALANAATADAKAVAAQAMGADAHGRFNNAGTLLHKYNVSSVVNNSTGNWTVNLSVALPDTFYTVLLTPNNGAAYVLSRTTTSFVIGCFSDLTAVTPVSSAAVSFAVFSNP